MLSQLLLYTHNKIHKVGTPSEPLYPVGVLLDNVTRTGTEAADQGHSPDPTDIVVTFIMTPTEAIPGHIIEKVDATIGVLHDTVTPVLIITTVTHHIEDHPNVGVLQLIQKITA